MAKSEKKKYTKKNITNKINKSKKNSGTAKKKAFRKNKKSKKEEGGGGRRVGGERARGRGVFASYRR